ncbi:MAG TPA: MerR family transcriptional regulator [Burkholderiales bacterium]|nr:MerR family transcriptional regulator [Burkholderiales bacterium]
MPTKSPGETNPEYAIGVVSKLTGIHPETLRMWERRYTIVRPGRSQGGSRRYSDEDIRHLSLIKTLVDAGHQISTIAPLSMEQLQARLDATSPRKLKSAVDESGPCRIIGVGGTLAAKITGGDTSRLELAAAFEDEAHMKRLDTFPQADALVVETATVQAETIGNIRRMLALSGTAKAVVVYGFGTRQALLDLESAGVTCLRAPVSSTDIAQACRNTRISQRPNPDADATSPGEILPRQFTPQQLARISTRAPVLACECPLHLVELINAMAAFETYSLECQHKNAEDAEIHGFLHTTAGRARTMLESALLHVARFEGIDVT